MKKAHPLEVFEFMEGNKDNPFIKLLLVKTFELFIFAEKPREEIQYDVPGLFCILGYCTEIFTL